MTQTHMTQTQTIQTHMIEIHIIQIHMTQIQIRMIQIQIHMIQTQMHTIQTQIHMIQIQIQQEKVFPARPEEKFFSQDNSFSQHRYHNYWRVFQKRLRWLGPMLDFLIQKPDLSLRLSYPEDTSPTVVIPFTLPARNFLTNTCS